jgi:hypothetical protein
MEELYEEVGLGDGADNGGAEYEGGADYGASQAGAEPEYEEMPQETFLDDESQGGRPDHVWRDYREFQQLRQELQSAGLDPAGLREAVRGLQNNPQYGGGYPGANSGGYGAPQQQQGRQQVGELDEYGRVLMNQFGAQVAPVLFQLQNEVLQLRGERESERLHQEANDAGFRTPALQKAYMAMRTQYPDEDPLAIRRALAGEVQSLLQSAKQRSGYPSPTMQAVTPQVNVPEIRGETAGDQWQNLKQAAMNEIVSLLG